MTRFSTVTQCWMGASLTVPPCAHFKTASSVIRSISSASLEVYRRGANRDRLSRRFDDQVARCGHPHAAGAEFDQAAAARRQARQRAVGGEFQPLPAGGTEDERPRPLAAKAARQAPPPVKATEHDAPRGVAVGEDDQNVVAGLRER